MKRLLVVVGLIGGVGCGAVRAGDKVPRALEGVTIEQHLDEQVPLDLKFHDEAGREVTLSQCCAGKPTILVLAYYRCPMLCTQVLNGLLEGLRGVSFDAGDAFQVVVVSFDPRETPALAAAKKASYLDQYGRPGAAAGWHFLTGEQKSIDRLTGAVGFRYRYDAERDQFAHASGIMILTPQGKIARYFYGIRYVSRDLRLGLVEASSGRIGSPVDQVLLFCYHYDPATGKYTSVAMGGVRIGGAVTVLLLGGFLLRSWRRDWRRSRSEEPGCLPSDGAPGSGE